MVITEETGNLLFSFTYQPRVINIFRLTFPYIIAKGVMQYAFTGSTPPETGFTKECERIFRHRPFSRPATRCRLPKQILMGAFSQPDMFSGPFPATRVGLFRDKSVRDCLKGRVEIKH